MYTALVQRTEQIKFDFTEEEFLEWKLHAPGSNHTHEKYAEYLAEVYKYDDPDWEAVEFGTVCVLFSRD